MQGEGMIRAFWEGFWYGANPMNWPAMCRELWSAIASGWCQYTHGGGYIMRDPSGRVNWQCAKCARWAVPVSESDEYALIVSDVREKKGEVE